MTGAAGPEWADFEAAVGRVQTIDELGEVLRRLRRRHARREKSAELTVRELARRSGYAYGLISEYLNGKILPPTDRFDVLIRLLGASDDEQRVLATARDRVEELRRVRRPAGGVPRELPADVYGFTGRTAELACLDLVLRDAGRGAALIAALTGTAGVGKTALAVHWAHRAEAAFPDGCLYADLRGYDPEQPVPPSEALAGFLRSLGVGGGDVPPCEAERAARYRTLLADRRMLVVLDNARDTDQVRPLLPGGPLCVVLVTSRDALTGLVARHGAQRINVDPFSPDEAVELLRLLLGDRVRREPAAARTLADRCARLPLALRLAAELAGSRAGEPLAVLDAELADVDQRLSRLDAAGESRSASRTVFSWSYQHLDAGTARAFSLLGGHPGHDVDAYALAALAGTELAPAASRLRDLARAHLIQPARPGRFGMHDLLRAYAAELPVGGTGDERRAAMNRLLDAQLYTASVAMDLIAPFDPGRRPKVADPGWPVPPLSDVDDALAWLDAERSNLVAAAGHADRSDRPEHPTQLAAMLVRYLDFGAHYHDAEVLFRQAMECGTDGDRAHVLVSLGIVEWRLGRYREAAGHLETALNLARACGDDTEEGRALLGLGIVYWHLGRKDLALQCGYDALRLYEDLCDPLGQARVLGNLGNMQSRLGDLTAALVNHERSLALFRQIGDPAGLGNQACSLASTLTVLGRYDEALDRLHEALAAGRQIGYRECEAVTLGWLGEVHLRLGRLDEALELQLEGLAVIESTDDRTNEGFAHGYLGTVYGHLGRFTEAIGHHHRGLRLARELDDRELTTELRNRFGRTLTLAGSPKKALYAHRRALAVATYTGNRYEQAAAHHGIARALAALVSPRDPGALHHWACALREYGRLGVPEAALVRAELAAAIT